MTRDQVGWFLFAVGLLVIVALLTGDIATLIQSGHRPDMEFIVGMLAHIGAVVAAFTGGGLLQQFGARPNAVSDQKRAELNEKAGV